MRCGWADNILVVETDGYTRPCCGEPSVDSRISELLKNDESLSPELAIRILTNRQVQLKSDKYLRDLRAEANIEKR